MLLAAIASTSCGRVGFDRSGDGGSDAPECTPEECDGLDDDCDGSVDEGCPCTPNERTLVTDEGATSPSFAWSGGGWGLAYATTPLAGGERFWWLELDAAGNPRGDAILLYSEYVNNASVVWTGDRFLVARERGEAGRVAVLALAPDGAALRADVDVDVGFDPQWLWIDGEPWLVYGQASSRMLARFAADGVLLDRVELFGEGSTKAVAVRTDEGFTVAYWRQPNVILRRFDRQRRSTGPEVVVPGGGSPQFAAAWTGQDTILLRQFGIDLVMAHVARDGSVSADEPFASSTTSPLLDADGTDLAATWTTAVGPLRVVAARLNSDGARVGADQTYGPGASSISTPVVEINGSRTALAWGDGAPGAYTLRFVQTCP